MTSIAAILFDCDGVLVDSEVVGLKEGAAFLNSHGFRWTPADMVRLFNGKRDDQFREDLLSAYADVLSRAPTESESASLFDGLIATRRAQRDTMTAVPGAADLLKLLADQNRVAFAVASSSRQIHLDRKID
ncbi:MAG: HAD family hydrolase, partial [Pseudomonadota bacterium]